MMGKQKQVEPKLFYHGVSLDRRLPQNHPLRKIDELGDDVNDELEMSSGDLTFAQIGVQIKEDYEYNASATFKGPIDHVTKAKAQLSAEGYCEETWPNDSYAEISSVSGSGNGGVGYFVGVPTYVAGTAIIDPEPGYDD